jgi:hypothetical protein
VKVTVAVDVELPSGATLQVSLERDRVELDQIGVVVSELALWAQAESIHQIKAIGSNSVVDEPTELEPIIPLPDPIECPAEGCDRTFATEKGQRTHFGHVHNPHAKRGGSRARQGAGSGRTLALRCEDCDASFELTDLIALSRHTRTSHGRACYVTERTPS